MLELSEDRAKPSIYDGSPEEQDPSDDDRQFAVSGVADDLEGYETDSDDE